jgi:hypothetical protein
MKTRTANEGIRPSSSFTNYFPALALSDFQQSVLPTCDPGLGPVTKIATDKHD